MWNSGFMFVVFGARTLFFSLAFLFSPYGIGLRRQVQAASSYRSLIKRMRRKGRERGKVLDEYPFIRAKEQLNFMMTTAWLLGHV